MCDIAGMRVRCYVLMCPKNVPKNVDQLTNIEPPVLVLIDWVAKDLRAHPTGCFRFLICDVMVSYM